MILPTLEPWLEHIRGQLGATIKTYGISSDFSQVLSATPALNAVFLIGARGDIKNYDASGSKRRAMAQQVLLVVGVQSDSMGARNSDALNDIGNAAINRLDGWAPPKAVKPVEYKGYRLLALRQNDHSQWYAHTFLSEVWL